MLIESADIFVRKVDMPYGIHGSVTPNDDGTYSVYINLRDSLDRQEQAYKHEKKHIEEEDFSKSDVRVIEGL